MGWQGQPVILGTSGSSKVSLFGGSRDSVNFTKPTAELETFLASLFGRYESVRAFCFLVGGEQRTTIDWAYNCTCSLPN